MGFKMKTIEAYKTFDKKIFECQRKAKEHQEGLRASYFLNVFNQMMPEKMRERFTYLEFADMQLKDCERDKNNEQEFISSLIDLIDCIQYKDSDNDCL